MNNHKKYQKRWRNKNKEYLSICNKKYRLTHKNYFKEYMKKYRKKYKKRIEKYRKNYYKNHREKYLTLAKKWAINHPEQVRISANNKRRKQYIQNYYYKNKKRYAKNKKLWRKTFNGRLASARDHSNHRLQTKDLNISIIQRVYEDNIKRYGKLTCIYCLQPIIFGKDTLEHKQPLSKGGTNKKDNLGIACEKCNYSKKNKTEKEFKQWSNIYANL